MCTLGTNLPPKTDIFVATKRLKHLNTVLYFYGGPYQTWKNALVLLEHDLCQNKCSPHKNTSIKLKNCYFCWKYTKTAHKTGENCQKVALVPLKKCKIASITLSKKDSVNFLHIFYSRAKKFWGENSEILIFSISLELKGNFFWEKKCMHWLVPGIRIGWNEKGGMFKETQEIYSTDPV